ncbi:MAG: ankyrin repeat domain-containing protein [Bacteroidota bacterium]
MLRFKSVLPVAAFVWLGVILFGCSQPMVNMEGGERSPKRGEADISAPNNNEVGAEHAVTSSDHGSTEGNQQGGVANGDTPSMEMDDALSSDQRESSSLTGLGEEASAAQGGLQWQQQAAAQDLHTAARDGRVKAIRALLKRDARIINIRDSNGRTPLHITAQYGRIDAIKVLINRCRYPRADVNAQDRNGHTPLHIAAMYGKNAAINLLLNHDALIDAQDKWGATPLHVAVNNDKHDTIRWLLGCSANTNIRDNYGDTPLAFATKYRHNQAMNILLSYDRGLQNNQGNGETGGGHRA